MRRPAPEWREPRSARALPERPAEREPPVPGVVSASREPVRCATVESDSAPERPEPVRCVAGAALALEPASLRRPAAAGTAPFSRAPFPFPAPVARQVPKVASGQPAALLPEVAEAALAA